MINLKNIIKAYTFLFLVNLVANAIYTKFTIIELSLYNIIITITYLLYREFNLWGEKTLIKLQRIQQGENMEDENAWQKIIKTEVEKAEKEK